MLFQIVAQLSGLLRHEIMDFMFADPTMLDDLDFLYKSDTARKLMFYYQAEEAAEGAAAEGGGQAAAGAPAGGERAGKSSKKSIRDGEIERNVGEQLCDQINVTINKVHYMYRPEVSSIHLSRVERAAKRQASTTTDTTPPGFASRCASPSGTAPTWG